MPRSTATADYRVFLRLLSRAREASGVTQTDLARRLRTTQSIVSKCERGERRLDIIEVRAWCLAIGVPLARFAQTLDRQLGASTSRPRRG